VVSCVPCTLYSKYSFYSRRITPRASLDPGTLMWDLIIFFKFMQYCNADTHILKHTLCVSSWFILCTYSHKKGKAVPLQAWSGPECSRKLRFPDYMTTAQDMVRLSPLHTVGLYPQEMLLVLISVRG
jgi:hypothetical protein